MPLRYDLTRLHQAGVYRFIDPFLERRTLLALLLLAAAAWAFAGIYDEVSEGESLDFDHLVLFYLRDPVDPSRPWGPGWLQTSVRDITALGGMTIYIPITLFAAGYLALVGKRGAALFVLCAILGATLLGHLMKLGLHRPRPDIVPHAVITYTSSFPSGHATGAAATYLTLGALLARFHPQRRIKIYLFSIAILTTVSVGLSRIYLGVHWPTDVLAGWTLGTGWALLCWTVAHVLQRRGAVEPTSPDPRAGPPADPPAPPGPARPSP